MIESGPIPAIHGVVRWRLIDLAQWIWEEFRISVAKQTLEPGAAGDGLPQALGPAAPSRPEPRAPIEAFKKTSPTRLAQIARSKALRARRR